MINGVVQILSSVIFEASTLEQWLVLLLFLQKCRRVGSISKDRKIERYRWEFCGHILVSLHVGLLCIILISSSSWTHSILSGKKRPPYFRRWFRDGGWIRFLVLTIQKFVFKRCFSASFYSCWIHCTSYNLSGDLFGQGWQGIRDAGGVAYPYSFL